MAFTSKTKEKRGDSSLSPPSIPFSAIFTLAAHHFHNFSNSVKGDQFKGDFYLMLRRLFSRGSSLFSCCCWHKRLRRARCTFRKSEERESSSSAPAKRLLQPFLFAHPFLNATLAAEWLNYKRAKPWVARTQLGD